MSASSKIFSLFFSLVLLLALAHPRELRADSICGNIQGNLVQNCGFDTQDYTGWTLSGSDPDGFDMGGDGFVEIELAYVHGGSGAAAIGPPASSDGSPSDPVGLTFVSQTLVTDPGTYDLTFYLAHSGDCSGQADCSEAVVMWNGVTLLDESNAGVYDYTQFSYTVTTTGTSTIAFGFDTNPGYYYLDDVSVTAAVPEPSSLITLASGILILAGAWRLKTRAAPPCSHSL